MWRFAIWLGVAGGLTPPTPEKTFEILGFIPALNVVLAQSFTVPDDQKCRGYILDFDHHVKFALGPVIDAGPALAILEGPEAASCQLRDLGALGVEIRRGKSLNETERKLITPLEGVDWSKHLAGFKDQSVVSFGAFLRLERPQWDQKRVETVFKLGLTEAADENWADALAALVIVGGWRPGLTTPESRERSRQISETIEPRLEKPAGDEKARAKLWLAAEVATRLDPKNARPWLNLALVTELGFDRRALLVSRALGLDPVMATRAFREADGLKDLRCDPKAGRARRVLPREMTKSPKCSDV